MKKTAVEWLVEELTTLGHNFKLYKKEIEQAKEMEKKQIIDAYGVKTESINQDQSKIVTGNQYYNETYKKD